MDIDIVCVDIDIDIVCRDRQQFSKVPHTLTLYTILTNYNSTILSNYYSTELSAILKSTSHIDPI